MAFLAVGLIGSAAPTTPTALPLIAKIFSPLTIALTPKPDKFSNFSILFGKTSFLLINSCNTAPAKGWDDLASAAATILNTSLFVYPVIEAISVTLGFPSVRVPVLSKTTAWILETCSRVGASLIRILCLAPRPVPTATAVGVAKPSASGQAITVVEMAKVRAKRIGTPITKYQPPKASRPPPTATITKYWANLSAIFCPGALELWAISTSFTIWAKAVSSPTLVALNLTDPD